MNCKKFETWLSSKQPDFGDDTPQTQTDHIMDCPDCRNAYRLDTRLESGIKRAFVRQNLPEDLFTRIDSAVDHAARSPVFSFSKIAVMAAGLSLLVAVFYFSLTGKPPRFQNLQQLSTEAVTKHLDGNFQMSFDAAGIDQALLMLRRELRFNLLLPDLGAKGYVLLGGRLCIVGDCRAAYLFYRKDAKISSLFIMDYESLSFEMADGSSFNNIIKGYRTDIWKQNAQVYAMVY